MQFGQSSQGFQPLVQRHDLQADEAGHQQKQHDPGKQTPVTVGQSSVNSEAPGSHVQHNPSSQTESLSRRMI